MPYLNENRRGTISVYSELSLKCEYRVNISTIQFANDDKQIYWLLSMLTIDKNEIHL